MACDDVTRKRYKAVIAACRVLLGGRCAHEGLGPCLGELEFDHVLPEHKVDSPHRLWRSRQRLLAELPKLQLLCARHHGLKTRADGRTPDTCNDHWDYGEGTI